MDTRISQLRGLPGFAARWGAALVILAGLAATSFGDVLKVPQDYSSIPEAIAAASPGDTILLANGTYPGGIVIDKPLRIASKSNNPSMCVIDCADAAANGVTIQGVDTSIEGVGIVNWGLPAAYGFAGVAIQPSTTGTGPNTSIANCVLSGGYGAAIHNTASNSAELKLTGCSLSCRPIGLGRQIVSSLAPRTTVIGCTFRPGSSEDVGLSPLHWNPGSNEGQLSVTGCTFTELSCRGNVGVIMAAGYSSPNSRVDIRQCRIVDCFVSPGNPGGGYQVGGLLNVYASSVQVAECTFERNQGPCVEVTFGSTALVNRCRFVGNHASDQAEVPQTQVRVIGPYPSGESRAVVSDCIFTDNGGTQVVSYPAPCSISSCTFVSNRGNATTSGADGSDSVISVGLADVSNCVFWGNRSIVGATAIAVSATWPRLVSASYCDIENGASALAPEVLNGGSIVALDPLLSSVLSGDYRLQVGSPCIDAGNAALLPPDLFDLDGDGNFAEPIPFDLAGNPRIWGAAPDFGAYEYVIDTVVGGVEVPAGGGATLTFDTVASPGDTTAQGLVGAPPALPANFSVDGATYYDIHTTATFTGGILVKLPYSGITAPKILHYENGRWVDVTTGNDTQYVWGVVTSLSPFAVAHEVFPSVAIDIKPGSYPNSINLGSNGTVAVALFSSATFSAVTIDPTTLTLAGASVKLKANGTLMSDIRDVNGDGRLDLVVHMSTEALQLSPTDTLAVLEGSTYSGQSVLGTDTVRVVP